MENYERSMKAKRAAATRPHGAIVVGYQGVGKSTLAFHNVNVIDLESSNFFVDDKRDENWYIPYCNIARSLARQGYIVCVSSHEVVRKELEKNPAERQVIVYPALALKDAWIRSLKHRYEQTENDKDFKALKNAEQCYEQNITDLANQAGFDHIEITSMDYNLQNMLTKSEVIV